MTPQNSNRFDSNRDRRMFDSPSDSPSMSFQFISVSGSKCDFKFRHSTFDVSVLSRKCKTECIGTYFFLFTLLYAMYIVNRTT